MKKQQQIVGLMLICAISLFSCREEVKGQREIKKVTTKIPAVLTSNTKVSEYFAAFDSFMEEYANMLEGLIKEGKQVEDNGGKTDFANVMGMMTTATSSLIKMAPFLEEMDRLEKEAEVLKGDMSSQELEAFMKSYTKIMIRFMEMSKKINNKE